MKRALFIAVSLSMGLSTSAAAQQLSSGKNVNVAGGPATLDENGIPLMGDPYLQRQNEPSIACSSRNPLNCLAGANDYRRMNFPGVKDGKVTGDAWLGTFWTRDGGNTWRSALLPGYAEDLDPLGQASPAHLFDAAADPMVRAGTNGMFYYSGIAFNRSALSAATSGAEGKDGVMFVARFIDDNNTQTVDTPFRYLGTSAAAFSNRAKFLDKPALAVDIPRAASGTCTVPARGNDIPAQSFPGGNVYVAYAAFMGPDDDVHTKIQFHRSTDCGATWSGAAMLSETGKVNQSPTIAIEPQTGRVYVAWREFAVDTSVDRIVVAISNDLGKTFSKGVVAGVLRSSAGQSWSFDQPTWPSAEVTEYRLFRTNSYPAACVASNGMVYVAWAQRGLGPHDETRIVYTTSPDGTAWSAAVPVESGKYNGHQFMPAIACAGDKVTLIWYDQRGDAIADVLGPDSAFASLLADTRSLTIPTRTLDVRAAHATAPNPFDPSVPVTRYPLGVYMNENGQPDTLQLQFSLENLPMFAGGVVPFIGDYIDVAPATVFQPVGAGDGQVGTVMTGTTFKNKRRSPKAKPAEPNGWVFNTTPEGTPAFHAIWTDNRDVVLGSTDNPIDPESPPCSPGTQAGSKNQNVYTSRLTSGLVAGVLGNARPLGSALRAFSVFVQNLTPATKKVELRIANQPLGGGTASFIQFPPIQFPPDPPDPRFPFPLEALVDDLAPAIPPFSAIARTVFVSGSGNSPVRVDVDEIITSGGTTTVGQQLFAMINPDPSNPAPLDPVLRTYNETHEALLELAGITTYDLTDPDFLNPNFLNPNFLNPNFLNPNFLNPNFLNPNFLNPNFLNPNFLNPNFLNPNFLNPNFLNPNFLNPNFLNPNFLNTTLTEITWDVTTDDANTSSSYLATLLSSMEFPENWQSQLLIYRVYLSPAGAGLVNGGFDCERVTSEQHDLLTEVLNPNFLNPNFLNPDFANPNFLNSALDPAENNATFSLASGDRARIVLRVAHDGTFQPSFVTAVVVPEAVDTADAAAGETTPTITPAPLAFAVPPTLPPAAQGSAYSPTVPVTVTVTGGTTPYTWSCVSCAPELPLTVAPGLQMDPTTGTIAGTPTVSGRQQFAVAVTDGGIPAAQRIEGIFEIVVNPQLLITTVAVPSANRGIPYSAVLQASGGVGARTWSVSSGLPTGIELASSGTLSGSTTAATGSFVFTARVTDSGTPQQTATRSFTLIVTQGILTFVQQPADGMAGTEMPPVTVRLQDGAGAVIPGVSISIAMGTNPTGALLSGPQAALTDDTGMARFAGLTLDRDGDGYTFAATAGGVTAVSSTFNIGSISFEMYPDGSPACFDCTVGIEFASRGVSFSFVPDVGGEIPPRLTSSTEWDAPGEPANHSISTYSVPNRGGYTGVLVATFGNLPTSVRFRLRAAGSGYTIAAFDANNVSIPAWQIQQIVGTYPTSCCGSTFHQAAVRINSTTGIARVEIDTGPYAVLLDNLGIAPALDYVLPDTAAAGAGQMITLFGTNIPDTDDPALRVFFRSGGQTLEGFVDPSASKPNVLYVRLPHVGDGIGNTELPLGPATVSVRVGSLETNGVPVTVASTPGRPILRQARVTASDPCASPAPVVSPPEVSITPGAGLVLPAFGLDTAGATVIFRQGATQTEVVAACTLSGDDLGLAAAVVVPNTLQAGPVTVTVRTAVGGLAGPESNPLSLTVGGRLALSGFGTPVLDGQVGAGEWLGAGQLYFTVNLPGGGAAPATLFLMNNGSDMFFALRYERDVPWSGGQFLLEFDNGADGVRENGDDILLFDSSAGPMDEFRTNLPPCTPGSGPASCGFLDTSFAGGRNDAALAFAKAAGFTVFEGSHPLNSGDAGHDFALAFGDSVGLALQVNVWESSGSAGTTYPRGTFWPDAQSIVVTVAAPPPGPGAPEEVAGALSGSAPMMRNQLR